MELVYDDINDELILSSPIKRTYSPLEDLSTLITGGVVNHYQLTHEIRLVFSFAKKNWRVECFSNEGKYKEFDNDLGQFITYSIHNQCYTEQHKTKFSVGGLFRSVFHWTPWSVKVGQGTTINNSHYTNLFINFERESREPYALYDQHTNKLTTYNTPVVGSFVTHVLGDNINDALLRRFIIGTVPRGAHITQNWRAWTNYTYDITKDDFVPTLSNQDPIFAYYRRSVNYATQSTGLNSLFTPEGWIDLMALNMTKYPSSQNPWFTTMQTPGGINWQAIDVPLARESLILHAPINTPFRRLQLLFASEVVIKLHDFISEYSEFRRRSY